MIAYVIIADIIKSKDIPDRYHFQQTMKHVLSEINRNSDDIVSPYTITLGDEFQAVYKSSDLLISDIISVIIGLNPVNIRFAIAHAEISTAINSEQALGMDGPAFHMARNGLVSLKGIQSSVIQFYGEPAEQYMLLNKSLQLSMSMMAGWKKNTFLIFHELLKGHSVKEIAPMIGISERGVYKIIDTQKLYNFKDYFNCLAMGI